MFKALRAAFPKTLPKQDWQHSKPEDWNWEQFCLHLTTLTRAECPDYAWVFRARLAVRQRSVALWEKVGVCLGCDGDLLNAGGEDDIPMSWGGLGLGEEGEYDPSGNQVFIAALEAVDPAERERAESELREEFGDFVEDDGALVAMMETVGEHPRPTGRATSRHDPPKTRTDPVAQYGDLGRSGKTRPQRSRSFVGLQILTSPKNHPQANVPRSPGVAQTPASGTALPIFERGPGSPLFPSSFSSLSVEPNLGRSASVGLGMAGGGGIRVSSAEFEEGGEGRRWSRIQRQASGAELSESERTAAISRGEIVRLMIRMCD